MSLPIEDYEQLESLAVAARRRARWSVYQWLFFACAAAAGIVAHAVLRSEVTWPVSPLEFVTSALFWAILVIGIPFTRLRAEWQRRPSCPQCRQRLNAERLVRAVATRACPLCQHVFPSRRPPEAQAVKLDAAHLPRVWLAHEMEVPPEATNDTAPIDESNPYAPSRDVTAPQLPLPMRSSNVVLQLVWLLWAATVWPVIAIFKSREQFIAELPPPNKAEDENWLAFAATYARSQRRTAWFLLPWTVVLPIYVFVKYHVADGIDLLRHDQPVEGMWRLALGAATSLIVGVAAVFGVWFVASILLQRRFVRWLNGSPTPAKAQLDEKTGYYALRLRFTDVTQQDQLPTVRFRFRQKLPGELVLRVVNFTTAEALEKKVSYAAANAWQTMELDVRWLVRQSDPNFFGDELHFISDPVAELEVDDLQIVRK